MDMKLPLLAPSTLIVPHPLALSRLEHEIIAVLPRQSKVFFVALGGGYDGPGGYHSKALCPISTGTTIVDFRIHFSSELIFCVLSSSPSLVLVSDSLPDSPSLRPMFDRACH